MIISFRYQLGIVKAFFVAKEQEFLHAHGLCCGHLTQFYLCGSKIAMDNGQTDRCGNVFILFYFTNQGSEGQFVRLHSTEQHNARLFIYQPHLSLRCTQCREQGWGRGTKAAGSHGSPKRLENVC